MSKSPFFSTAILAVALASPAFAQDADAPGPAAVRVAAPSPDVARQAAQAAVLACERMGYKTMATVVDTAGRPVAAMTADPQLTPALAGGSVRHAALAAEFHSASSDVARRVTSDAAVAYTLHDNPKLAPAEPGGVPLTGPDNPKGAIGVAGTPDGAKDEACAKAGADKIASRLK